MFDKLVEFARANVETRNQQVGRAVFVIDPMNEERDTFRVRFAGRAGQTRRGDIVALRLSGNEIVVTNGDLNTMFSADVVMGADQQCRFRVDGTELSTWQVAERALQALLFIDLDHR